MSHKSDDDEDQINVEENMEGVGFFQQQMHKENLRRLGKLEETHNEMSKTLARIDENTKDLPQLKQDVDNLKGDRNKILGAATLVVSGTPVISWIAARFFKW